MKPTYDIFRRLPDGGPIWIEAVQSLQFAKDRLTSLLEAQPGEYFVYDLFQSKIVEYLDSRSLREDESALLQPPHQK
ncbi:MAG TPA: hypothetical protein VN788_00680 [Verrucomicrobiae bacterium]|nr:hypothetical protein [Verrucomicrobiae bacterium]